MSDTETDPSLVPPESRTVTVYSHCGSDMHVYSSHVREVDGEQCRIKYWRCPECGATASSSDLIPE
jgi:hypothetical protein